MSTTLIKQLELETLTLDDLLEDHSVEVKIKCRFLNVTPALARELLKRNTKNRPISKANLIYIENEIKNGNWKITGEAILFDKNNNLLNGQHRLVAIVKLQQSLPLLVITGLDTDIFPVLDTGRRRSGGDVLSINDFENADLLASTIRVVNSIRLGYYHVVNKGRKAFLSNNDILKYVNDNPKIVESVKKGVALYNKSDATISPSIITSFHFLLSEISADAATDFLTKLCVGSGLETDSPILALKKKLVKAKNDKRYRITQSEVINYFIIAWNKNRKNEKIKMLKLPEENVVLIS